MQTVDTLTYEKIPKRFCEYGEAEPISQNPSDAFSYRNGWSSAYTAQGKFIKRQEVNAVGRLGTSAQALIQDGGMVGFKTGSSYGMYAVVSSYDGISVVAWMSTVDNNTAAPLGDDASAYYIITNSADVSDGLLPNMTNWKLAGPDLTSGFFDA